MIPASPAAVTVFNSHKVPGKGAWNRELWNAFNPTDSYGRCSVYLPFSSNMKLCSVVPSLPGMKRDEDATHTFREISNKSFILKPPFEHEQLFHFLRTDIHLRLTSFKFTLKLNLQVEPFQAWNTSRSWERSWDCRQCCWQKADQVSRWTVSSFESRNPIHFKHHYQPL